MRHYIKLIYPILFVLTFIDPFNSFSQNTFENNVFESFVKDELNKWKVPGAAIAVVKDGEIIYSKGFGVRDIETQLTVNENTLFAIGSITKSFTASTVGILVDKEIVKWDSKIIDLIPNFKLKDEFASQHLTLVDALTHRSGLPDHNLMWYVTDFSREDIVHRLRYLEPSKEFRTTFQYNPNMYTLTGYVIGKQSGMSWEGFTQQYIFNPLGMHRSNFTWMDMVKDDNYANPYVEKNGSVIKTNFHASQHKSAPAGSINSSVKEMAQWMLLNLNQGEFKGNQIISPESLNYIQSPHITFPSTSPEIGAGPEGNVYSYSMYGLGWGIGTYHNQIVIEHAGAIDGFSSKLTLLPRLNAGVIILTNNQMGGDFFGETITNRILTNLMNIESFDFSGWFSKQDFGKMPSKPAKKVNTIATKKPLRNLDDYVGEYIDNGYGKIIITRNNDSLHFKYYRFDVDLEHIDFDIFKTVQGIINRKVNFVSSTDNKINRLEIQWDRNVKPIVFYKK